MPQPPAGQDYYLVVGLHNNQSGVYGAASLFVATGTSEENAVAKVAPLCPDATIFTALVTPTFARP